LSTKRSKRWDGNLDSLSTDFLKQVLEKMDAYGDRIQFEMAIRGAGPCYQVINQRDRKMGFDSNHLLLKLNENGHVGEEMSDIFSLSAVQAAADGLTTRTTSRARAGTPRPRTAKPAASPAVAAADTIDQEKYAYFKANRDALPDDIHKYSQHIGTMMRTGMSAEMAFEAVIKEHYPNGY
jgi:hypothetical protein